MPIRRIEINNDKDTYLIFASEQIETHKIKIVKVSENSKGKVGIRSFFMKGDINQKSKVNSKKLYIEFIGDSITCGFGNETKERDRFFFTQEENGWMSHAAIAARKLNVDFSIISVSGITVGRGLGKMDWPLLPMNEIYRYTDSLIEEVLGKNEPIEEWDFSKIVPDIIVINLGTNDSTLIA